MQYVTIVKLCELICFILCFTNVHNLTFIAYYSKAKQKDEEVFEYINHNKSDIITPVKPLVLKELLEEAGYDSDKTKFLVNGFTEGFSLKYNGNLKNVRREAPNLKLQVGSKTELWNKVMNEVKLGRYAGPFKKHLSSIMSSHQLD